VVIKIGRFLFLETGVVFVANNKGLIVLDKKGQSLYKTPDILAVRSVKSHDKRVYTGAFEEMGYWEEKF
jgi:AraC family chitin signaling transcriptional activator